MKIRFIKIEIYDLVSSITPSIDRFDEKTLTDLLGAGWQIAGQSVIFNENNHHAYIIYTLVSTSAGIDN